jgi:hypothetical protein
MNGNISLLKQIFLNSTHIIHGGYVYKIKDTQWRPATESMGCGVCELATNRNMFFEIFSHQIDEYQFVKEILPETCDD